MPLTACAPPWNRWVLTYLVGDYHSWSRRWRRCPGVGALTATFPHFVHRSHGCPACLPLITSACLPHGCYHTVHTFPFLWVLPWVPLPSGGCLDSWVGGWHAHTWVPTHTHQLMQVLFHGGGPLHACIHTLPPYYLHSTYMEHHPRVNSALLNMPGPGCSFWVPALPVGLGACLMGGCLGGITTDWKLSIYTDSTDALPVHSPILHGNWVDRQHHLLGVTSLGACPWVPACLRCLPGCHLGGCWVWCHA